MEPVRELICALPEHVHTEACYEELTPGDPTADLETAADWEASMSGVVLTGDYRTDLLAIAETQLGYRESTLNFIIDEAGFVKGYTRYGEWYGIPYGDWCAMFVSFCLRYAEVPNFPYNCGCTTWINALSAEEYRLYEKAGEYDPQPGDIIFFDFDGDLASDHVGIVSELIEETETEKAKLRTIEGNAADMVCSVTYEADSAVILGFGRLPEKETGYICEKVSHTHDAYCYSFGGLLLCPFEEHSHIEECISAEPVYLCGIEEHTHSETCYDEAGELICGLEEHQHSESCQQPELTEEEQAQVEEVIALIDALPTSEEIEETTAAFEEAEDEDGLEAYLSEVYPQINAAYEAYSALTDTQKAKVTNTEKLMALEWIWSDPPQDGNFTLTTLTETGIEVTVSGPLESLPYPPSEITLTVSEIVNETAEQLRDLALEEEGLTAKKNYLFDVSLWHAGELIEPVGPVSLTFTGLPLEGTEEFKVYHIDEEAAEAIDMNAVLDDEAGVVLDTEHFSTYSVSLLTAATGSYTMTATHKTTADMYADSDISEYLLLALEGGKYYALGGDGETYEVSIESDSSVQYSGTVDQIKNLCWTLSDKWTDSGNEAHRTIAHRTMYIKNEKTGFYLYPNENGLLTGDLKKVNLWFQADSNRATVIYPTEDWPKIAFGNSHKFHTYQKGDLEGEAWFYFAKVDSLPYCHVWLDGTDGGLMSLGGAGNICQEIEKNTTFSLPDTFTAPEKYSYRLTGWYDVKSAKYYQPGATVTITQDTVFYADWAPVTYDIGQSNDNTVQSLNTNAFITTHVFDYGALFNVQSSNADTVISGAGHDENWKLANNSLYSGSSLSFVFRDWDTRFKNISYPVGSETWNGEVKSSNPNDNNSDIYTGLYNSNLVDLLFNPNRTVIGKTYVGTGNYLYRYDDAKGYYYYDSKLNAASYNQSASRFYIYNYLERTSDSPKDSATAARGKDSDFLPFNSPYANTNGKTILTYTADNNMRGYQYDAKYDSTEGGVLCSPSNAGTNYWFGMSSSINFYLPDDSASDGSGKVNQSTKGTDMIFKFSGDDDVWVLVDGQLVLDIGGLHGVEEGYINFSNGEVWRSAGEGKGETKDYNFYAGEHTLKIYYLERGGSQSNCAIYFNIAPREYTLELTKTDRDYPNVTLPDAEFTVYADDEFTTVASGLKDASGNPVESGTFVSDEKGQIQCYGLLPGRTYYIKETKAPPGYNGNEDVYIKLSIGGIEESYHITSELYVNGQLVNINDPSNIFLTQDLSHAGEERTVTYVFSNKSGFELPNTGGAGTVPYTIGGLLLLTGAAFLLLYNHTKRRKGDSASS